MTSREEFEAWYQREVSGCNGEFIAKDDAGEYLEVYTFRSWLAWQAARATAPAWHDAPTAPGLWLSERNNCAYLYPDDWAEPEPYVRKGSRWYGPIPKDAT